MKKAFVAAFAAIGATLGLTLAAGAAAQEAIRIGAPLPITGPLAPEAAKQKRGYDLWAELVNKAGGVKVGDKRHKVEIVYMDYQSNTPRAVQGAEKLITQDKVQFLFAPFGSGATKAASSVAERYRIPMIAVTASSEQVYDQGYKYLFGTFTPNQTLTEPISDIVKKRVSGAIRVAILARNDLFPLAIAQELEKSAKKRGIDVVYFEKYAIGTLDHASALSQIKAAAPNWIFATGYTNDLVLMRKQMADLQVEAPVVTMIAAPAYQEFIDASGKLAENISSASWWHPAVRYQGKTIFGSTENFVKLFEAKYKSTPDYVEASAAVSGALFQLAIERAGALDPVKVRDALAQTDLTTFWGPVRFGPNGQITSLEPPVFQIQGGKPIVVHPAPIAQGELKLGVK
ncbi:MAG: amino acid ABC transporter substrate-binding protein [Burkholderiales bacterium]|nr:amino acid ABC transporter substrate-binding protein [Burkholderiales bacterium]